MKAKISKAFALSILSVVICTVSQESLAARSSRYYYAQDDDGYTSYYNTSNRMHNGFARKRPATGKEVFIFSPRLLEWAAYDRNGNLVRTGRASGGSNYCHDVGRSCRTPRGKFSVYHKGTADCRSSIYPKRRNGPSGGARMPHCMFFKGGYAIHGSADVPMYNASHGCIRVIPSDAAWLSRNFLRHGSTVIVANY